MNAQETAIYLRQPETMFSVEIQESGLTTAPRLDFDKLYHDTCVAPSGLRLQIAKPQDLQANSM